MKKPRIIRNLAVIVIIGAVIVGKTYFGLASSGKPVTVQINGTDLKVNDTKVEEMVGKGYTLGDGSMYALSETIEKKSYTPELASLNKDNTKYVDFAVVNHSGSSEDIKTCKIISVEFFYGGEFIMGKTIKTYEDAIIDGFNPRGMTKEQVKAKITKKVAEDESRKLRIEDGDYYCQYNFGKDGKVSSVEVGIEGSKIKTS